MSAKWFWLEKDSPFKKIMMKSLEIIGKYTARRFAIKDTCEKCTSKLNNSFLNQTTPRFLKVIFQPTGMHKVTVPSAARV